MAEAVNDYYAAKLAKAKAISLSVKAKAKAAQAKRSSQGKDRGGLAEKQPHDPPRIIENPDEDERELLGLPALAECPEPPAASEPMRLDPADAKATVDVGSAVPQEPDLDSRCSTAAAEEVRSDHISADPLAFLERPPQHYGLEHTTTRSGGRVHADDDRGWR